jgi:hypothetical protein
LKVRQWPYAKALLLQHIRKVSAVFEDQLIRKLMKREARAGKNPT